ncbi:hypothetical protein SLA2020_516200 [Shorea laevis]
MASMRKLLWWVLVLLMECASFHLCIHGEPQVPCYFIFGDSLVDSGNNNNLQTLAKVNYHPYGMDFPAGPTGRFYNGLTPADIIAEHLGFEHYIPPFATASGGEILQGLNYASGSSGIRNETGRNWGANINLNKQIENHRNITSQIAGMLGRKESAYEHLNKCLYSVVTGSNDYMNNYFMPQFYDTSGKYSPEQYADVLTEQYSQQLRTLYLLGARKVSIQGLLTIGCTPNATHTYERKGTICVDSMNNAAYIFNQRLKSLINKLNHDLSDAKFVFVNIFDIPLTNTYAPGLNIEISGCCEVDINGLCIHNKAVCQDRILSSFWDGFHPSEAVNNIIAAITYTVVLPLLYEPQ